MPEKDGSEDKKSVKSVVNKKQKQFMNQEEQLDLSSVAESFGGEIVGEPVELDEGVLQFFTKTAKFLKKPAARKTIRKLLDPKVYKQTFKNFRKKKSLEKIFNKSKNFDTIGGSDGYTKFNPKPPIKEPFKPLKPLKDFIRTGTEKAKTQFAKIKDSIKSKKTKNSFKDALNKNQNKNKNKNLLKTLRNTSIAGTVGTLIGTQTGKKGTGGFRMGGLPGTAHNVGRRTNPQ
tara:strand:+ start:1056 stop:1748 length:693 start_codon:yes stop_codon:yes gene_type:complete